jgi:diguanylate cyclase (GGDEF)-like protein
MSLLLALTLFPSPIFPTIYIGLVVPAILAPLLTWLLVGLAIDLHHLEDEMRHLANYDELTDIMTRRAFLAFATRLHALMQRQEKPFTVAYMDLDNFKSINDQYGHLVGDDVLKSFSDVVRSMIRRSDIVGRIGGEEFALALPETDLNGAIHLLNQLRLKASETKVVSRGHEIHYTVSVGLAFSNKTSSTSLETLLEQADRALYQAKTSGKDCVVQFVPTYASA